jgi:protein gp37
VGAATGIAWTNATFNPWIGCQDISPGCKNCYAAAYAKRVGRDFSARTRTAAAYWRQPLKWQRHAENGLLPDGKTPSGGRSPRVFCASLADVFDKEAPDEWRRDLWDLIESTPRLTWLLLTKRIGNALRMLRTNDWALGHKNVWLGATIVNQEEADRDVPKLLATPASVRFVSYEPALGPVNWSKFPGIDWIIVGGESTQGAKAREFPIVFAQNTVRQARKIGAAPFVKQLGSNVIERNDAGFEGDGGDRWPAGTGDKIEHDPFGYREEYQGAPVRVHLEDRAGADPLEWPIDLRIQEFPREV